MIFQRTLLSQAPFGAPSPDIVFHQRGVWPAKWIAHPDAATTPVVVAYRCRFSLANAAQFRLHVSADERYELFCNGQFIGRGSERGDGDNWPFETLDCELKAGNHTLVARVWSLGDKAPFAQMHLHHGFLLVPKTRRLGRF